MDVILAKALNSTLGQERTKGFDELLLEDVERIKESINSNATREIENKKTIKGLVASTPEFPEHIYRCAVIRKSMPEKTYEETMPCKGSAYIQVSDQNRHIDVSINGVSVVPAHSFSPNVKVSFEKGDVLKILEKTSANLLLDAYVFIYAKEVNLSGLVFE